MDCHALLQGIFPTQGSKPGLPHCRQILDHLSYLAHENTFLFQRKYILPSIFHLETFSIIETSSHFCHFDFSWLIIIQSPPLFHYSPSCKNNELKCEVLVTQSCPTLCEPMDCTLPGSSVHSIFQAWILEWAAIPFSRGSSWLRNQTWVSSTAGSAVFLYCLRHQGLPREQ